MNLFSTFIIISVVKAGEFNPFSDEDLFAINWAGPIDLDLLRKKNADLEIVSVQTEEDEKYQCVIPESQASIDATRKATYNGPTPDELMEGLFSQSSCSYRIESYWTYELCHGKYLRQYHENKELGMQKSKLQEFYLGRIENKETEQGEKHAKGEMEGEITKDTKDPGEHSEQKEKVPQEIHSVKIDGLDLPFYSVNMSHGTDCDLTGKPRLSHMKYICQPNGRGEIYQLKETSSCEYDVIVLTAILCSHPSFKPKDPPVSKINCHPVAGSPSQPKKLVNFQTEHGIKHEQQKPKDEEEDDEDEEDEEVQTHKPVDPKLSVRQMKLQEQKQKSMAKTDTKIGVQADKQLLRDFLNGDYCIHGGGGWWKHEFCYNKHAKQYHEEPGLVTSIYLGYWDKQKHLDWLKKNPAKRPRPSGQRRQISLFYTGGDTCDLTGTKRFVEVKLKCVNKPENPHAVAIYLVEPKSCEYVLGVESQIFCALLDRADENGLMDHIVIEQ